MGVIKRKSKTAKNGYLYEVNFTFKENGITKRHFKRGFTTKKEAELYELEKKNEIRKNGILVEKKKITLNEAFNEFLNYGSSQYQENTLYNSKKDWHYFKENLGLMKINEITYFDLQNFFDSRMTAGLATNKNIRKTLNRVFVYSIRQQYLDKNPLQFVVVKGEDRSKKKELISQDDLNKILFELSQKQEFNYKAYIIAILIGYYTGLRVSEALALNKQDVLFAENKIIIDKKLIYKGLKKEEYYVSNRLKSRKSKSIIPLPDVLKKYLIKWFNINPYDKVICDEEGYYINPTYLSNQVNKVAMKFHIHFNYHLLRHCYASELASHNVGVKIAQELLRHDNFNTTYSIYSHVSDNQKAQAVNEVFKMDCGDFVAIE